MKRITRTARTAAIGVVAAAATALFAVPANAATAGAQQHQRAHHSASHSRAVFVQSDSPSGNTVVVYDRATNGSLTQAGVYPTGGVGGVLAGSAVDHLASEGSLTFDQDHRLLYAVNAGSDTVSVFAVDGDRLSLLQTVSTGGTFPVSVTVHGDLVYVLNALGGGSVQGFVQTRSGLESVPSWNRALGLDPSATPQFTHTPGQISFTPDGSALVVTTKANTNSIDVFPLAGRAHTPSAQPVVTTEAGAVPFGFTFDPAGRLEVTQVGTGTLDTYTVGRDGSLTAVGSAATGQAATCWVVRAGDRFYTSNAGSATLSGFQGGGDGMLTALGNTATDPGTVDAAASPDGRFVYVQTGALGDVDGFRVNADGSLTPVGSVTVPGAVGGEGIAVS
jgi:6-phosphogluconolactonase (cycloisomerase 2 family)